MHSNCHVIINAIESVLIDNTETCTGSFIQSKKQTAIYWYITLHLNFKTVLQLSSKLIDLKLNSSFKNRLVIDNIEKHCFAFIKKCTSHHCDSKYCVELALSLCIILLDKLLDLKKTSSYENVKMGHKPTEVGWCQVRKIFYLATAT